MKSFVNPKRFEDWTIRLDAYLIWVQEESFSWGSNDCVLFACNVVHELTGTDLAKKFRGKYHTKAGAYSALKKFAGGGLEALAVKIAAQYEMEEVPVRMAQRGDIVLLEATEGPTLAIVCLDGVNVTAPGPTGLVRWPVDKGSRAWRVG
ncbi:hypothetical protein LCGC14_1286970 [marine sediment metagenome]|uniref:DUF6950 domain-containing protein n=1 Tax=marine sediment metagenome TaxID=412755 RepID=A0A0F9NWI9_9ZZZZ